MYICNTCTYVATAIAINDNLARAVGIHLIDVVAVVGIIVAYSAITNVNLYFNADDDGTLIALLLPSSSWLLLLLPLLLLLRSTDVLAAGIDVVGYIAVAVAAVAIAVGFPVAASVVLIRSMML